MDRDLISQLELPLKGPLMVAFVGAGGKTTTMLALAREYKAHHKRVLVTTTTRIFMPPETFSDAVFLGKQLSQPGLSEAKGTITVAGESVEGDGKLVGLGAEELDGVFENGGYDIILIEADGSKGKPLKAPADYEPVIPRTCTHVVGIIGMDAFGQPVNNQWIHRLETFQELTGATADQCIDAAVLKNLIGSPRGLFKNTPEKSERILLLNKCTDAFRREAARLLIAQCLQEGTGKLNRGIWI